MVCQVIIICHVPTFAYLGILETDIDILTGVKRGVGTAHSSGAHEFILSFLGFMLICLCLVDRCLTLCLFFFWALCCLSFDLRVFIIPLVS